MKTNWPLVIGLFAIVLLFILSRRGSGFIDANGIAWPCPDGKLSCPNAGFTIQDVAKKCQPPLSPPGEFGIVSPQLKCVVP